MNTTAVRIIVILVIIVLIVISTFLLIDSPKNDKSLSAEVKQSEKLDPEKLSGRWQRADGGYIIEIKSVRNDGGMDAAYLNPQPINVSASEWSRVDNRLQIYVEMSDVNYPGSYYKLVYFSEQDQLVGLYHQAVYKQNYEVQFIRLPDN